MRSYGQYCPIARGAAVLAERWTPIILRNLLNGHHTFNAIAEGAPGLSRGLLTQRLRELERAGVIEIHPKPDGRGSHYVPTAAGREAQAVLAALGAWGDRWTDVLPEDADPNAVLWSWSQNYAAAGRLPRDRVVVRFELPPYPRAPERAWFLIHDGAIEICRFDPRFGDDLVVRIHDAVAFARWHLGRLDWSDVVRSRAVTVEGPTALRRALPTWNRAPEQHRQRRGAGEPSAMRAAVLS